MAYAMAIPVSNSSQILEELVTLLSDALPSSVGPRLCEILRNGDYRKISTLTVNYGVSVDQFRNDYLFSELLSKYPGYDLGQDKRANARSTFREGETQNRETYLRLLHVTPNPILGEVIRRHEDFLGWSLGRVEHQLKTILDGCYFGPGATIGVRGDRSSMSDKVQSNWTVTEELLPYAPSLLRCHPMISAAILGADGQCSILNPAFEVVEGCKLAFVPKNAKTDRSITIEPTTNSFLQNGIGRYLRKIASSVCGLTLDDQERNAEMARRAYKEGWATIDLANASNTLSVGLVHASLRRAPGWYQLLDLARSKRYVDEKETHRFQLFAGMGNGFTFPLESLIFYSVALSCMQQLGLNGVPIVYGDDILVPSDAVELLIEVFSFLGLSVNSKKSFWGSHPFRESCGAHYYYGNSVTPVYIRHGITTSVDLLKIHNRIWEWATQDGITFDTRVIPALRYLRRLVAPQKVSLVHPELGDVGLFPLSSIGSGFVIRYSVLKTKTMLYTYRGATGWWCAMHTAINAVGSGGSGTAVERGYARRSYTSPLVQQSKTNYYSYKFPYIRT